MVERTSLIDMPPAFVQCTCQNLHFSESCIKLHYVANSVATGKQETVKEAQVYVMNP